MQKLHRYVVIMISILLTIFILQNMQTVAINILFWQINMPRALLIAVLLSIGVLMGLLLRLSAKKPNKAQEN